jgi:hypothetical protein
MTHKDHQRLAEMIAYMALTVSSRRKLLRSFCNQFAGDGLQFRRDEFVRQASNGRWNDYHNLIENIQTKEGI